MAAKFTAGDSIKTTRSTASTHRPGEPKTHSASGLRGGNTMSGAPGPVDTKLSAGHGGAKGGKGMASPKANSGLSAKTREIGSRGGSGAKSLNHPGKKATGTMASGKMESLKGRAETSFERTGKGRSVMY